VMIPDKIGIYQFFPIGFRSPRVVNRERFAACCIVIGETIAVRNLRCLPDR
jgi:hypothetical protein